MEFSAFDSYTLKARYYPTVIVVAPLCLAVLSWAYAQFDFLTSLGAAAVSGLGLAFVMDQVGRDGGRNKQGRLFGLWGGVPTTLMLRHADQTLEPPSKSRYHKFLAKKLPDIDIPTKEAEVHDPASADAVYSSCVEYLKVATRDHAQFPLVFQENINYGFRRNLWGMRPAGIATSLAGTAASAAAWIALHDRGAIADGVVAGVATGISAMLASFWMLRFTPSWVRTTAFAYARQLLASCDSPHLAEK